MFQVGQHVLCVNADPNFVHPAGTHSGDMSGLMAGTVYTVRANVLSPVWGTLDILLWEITRPAWCGVELGFHVSRFRPLSSDRLSIFRQHLAPIDKVLT